MVLPRAYTLITQSHHFIVSCDTRFYVIMDPQDKWPPGPFLSNSHARSLSCTEMASRYRFSGIDDAAVVTSDR
jgi:hypothetical protein